MKNIRISFSFLAVQPSQNRPMLMRKSKDQIAIAAKSMLEAFKGLQE